MALVLGIWIVRFEVTGNMFLSVEQLAAIRNGTFETFLIGLRSQVVWNNRILTPISPRRTMWISHGRGQPATYLSSLHSTRSLGAASARVRASPAFYVHATGKGGSMSTVGGC